MAGFAFLMAMCVAALWGVVTGALVWAVFDPSAIFYWVWASIFGAGGVVAGVFMAGIAGAWR